MAGGVDMEINVDAFLKALANATESALAIIAGKMENYTKDNIASDAPHDLAPELRNSITSEVKDGVVSVGSNQNVAAYIELGTGPMYEPPPEYMENHAKGGKGQAGLSSWWYFDPVDEQFHIGKPQPAPATDRRSGLSPCKRKLNNNSNPKPIDKRWGWEYIIFSR